MDLKEIELEVVDGINVSHVRDNMAGFLNVKIKLMFMGPCIILIVE